MTLAFDHSEYARRVSSVRARMAEADLDGLLVTGPENVTYPSGFTTTGYHIFQCFVVPASGDPFFVLRNIKHGNAEHHAWTSDGVAICETDEPARVLSGALSDAGLSTGRIGFDDRAPFLPVATVESLRAALAPSSLVPAGGLIEAIRAVKSAAEIAVGPRRRRATMCTKESSDGPIPFQRRYPTCPFLVRRSTGVRGFVARARPRHGMVLPQTAIRTPHR